MVMVMEKKMMMSCFRLAFCAVVALAAAMDN